MIGGMWSVIDIESVLEGTKVGVERGRKYKGNERRGSGKAKVASP